MDDSRRSVRLLVSMTAEDKDHSVLADMLRLRRCDEEVSSLRRGGHCIGHTGLRRKTWPFCGARRRVEFCNPRTTPARARVGQGVRS